MGDLIKTIQDAAKGIKYTPDTKESQAGGDSHSNVNAADNKMSNPKFLQHSYDGGNVISQPKTIIAEDDSK